MMATHLLRSIRVVKKTPGLSIAPVRQGHNVGVSELDPDLRIIGNREVVGAGFANQLNYSDRADVPCPAIRFKRPDTPGLQALREKEKGDWHQLTKEEKKALYRASFRQTLVEVKTPTQLWKSGLGVFFYALGITGFIVLWLKSCILDPLPESLSLENRQWQLMRVLDLELENIEGISSKYDYEKGEWKK